MRPENAEAHLDLGWVRHHQSRPAEAIEQYRAAREMRPGWPEPTARLAWILATCPRDDIRRPAEALRLAEEAVQSGDSNSTGMLDTLAAAYAAAGRYEQAAGRIRQALEQLPPEDHSVPALRDRLDLYLAGQVYLEPTVPPIPPR